jgi:invasion protein IalB
MGTMREGDSEIPFLAEVRPGYDEHRVVRPARKQRNQMKFLVAILVALIVVAIGLGAAIYIQTTSGSRASHLAAGSSPAPTATPAPPATTSTLKPTLTQAPANGAPAADAPAAGAAPPPQPKIVKQQTFGDWIYSCIELPNNGGTSCGIAQQISIAKTKQTLFLWRIGDDGKGGFVSTWQTPTDVFVGHGLTIEAGTPKPLVIPFQLCTTRGCQAVAGVKRDFLDTFAKAGKVTAKFVIINGREITINVSVKGLPDALAQLEAH